MEQKILRGSCQESISLIVKNDKKKKTFIRILARESTYEREGRVKLCNKGDLSFSLVIILLQKNVGSPHVWYVLIIARLLLLRDNTDIIDSALA